MNRNTNLRPLSASLIVILLCIFSNKGWTQCNIPVNAGPDQTVCSSAGSTQLNGSTTALDFLWSPVTGLSDPNSLSTQAIVTQTTTYTLSAFQPSGINLITNGDFTQGNSGFTSDYGFDNCPPNQWGSLGCEGAYVITTNTGTTHTNFAGCTDHTTGSGNMMAINGASNAIDVWCQVISVNPNTNYNFSAWVTSLVSDSPARLQFSINGSTIGNIFNVSPATCLWQEFSAMWNSGGTTMATICITNQNNAVGGNDFAIDDISFEEVCTVTDEVTIEVVEINAQVAPAPILDCNSILQCISLDGSGSTSSLPGIQYQWTASNNGTIQSGENTASPVVCGAGTYTLVVSVMAPDGTVCTDNPHVVNVTSNNQPPQPPTVDGPLISCTDTPVSYTFMGPQLYQSNTWFVVGDGILITDPADPTAEVIWNSAGTGQVCLDVNNYCDIFSTTTCYDVVISDSPEAPILTGPMTICPDGNPVPYSVDNLSPTDNIFNWSPPPGATLIQTGSDNMILLLWDNDATGGTLCVDVENDCGLVPTECLTIMVNAPLNTNLDTLICSGTTFNYNGTIYGNGNLSGTENIMGFNGCDSLIVMVTVAELIVQNVSENVITCDATQAGMVSTETISNLSGCDSVVIETTLVYTAPLTESENEVTCDAVQAGMMSTETLSNVLGCDSVVIETTLVYTAPLTESENEVTCDAAQAGMMSTETISNVLGCDSVVIETTLVYTAPLTESENEVTCDAAQAGMMSTETISNISGCDSIVIETTLVYTAPLTESENEITCDASQAGMMSTETILNILGCDSVVIETTLVYTTPVSENTTGPTCDQSQTGMMSTETLTSILGCDSVYLTTTLVYNATPVNESIFVPTCDPGQSGVMNTETITSLSGCDSVILTTTLIYTAPTNQSQMVSTCDPLQAGMINTETLFSSIGCDSVLIETTLVYTAPVNEDITSPTCDPSQAGMMSTETIPNVFGCDSVIITTTLVFTNVPINETVMSATCDASQGGMMSTETISSVLGCDSVIIMTTLVYTAPINETVMTVTCDASQGGMVSSETLTNISGCDSLITTTMLVYTNVPINETVMSATCDASQGGMMSTETISSVLGCDSVIITTTLVYTVPINEAVMTVTCDASQGGMVSSETLTNISGCDSLITTTTLVYTAPINEDLTSLTCDPSQAGMMSTETIPNVFGCDSVIVTTTLVFTNVPINETVMSATCDATQGGTMSTETISSVLGCDSVIITTTLVYTAPINETVTVVTCDASQAGMSTETLTNISGCDSLIRTTTMIYTAPVNEDITAPTCDPSQAGMMSTETIPNISGCDSVIIMTTLVFSSVPVNETATMPTCDISQGGTMSTETISSVLGCDSVIITTTLVYTAPINETATTVTCDPSQAGMMNIETLTNVAGCDSLIRTMTMIYTPPINEDITATTCNSSQGGTMSTETISTVLGCDSVIVTTTLIYTVPTNEAITAITCDASQAGMMSTETLTNVAGCDSLITTTMLVYTAPLNENRTALTCDPSQGGVTNSQTLINMAGCDSLIITTMVIYIPPINETATLSTCDPTQAGTTTTTSILNLAGCDSVIVTTTAILIEATTTNLTEMTCDPNEVGVTSAMLTGYEGCDSLVITETTLSDINICSVEAVVATMPIGCGNSEGDISLTVEVGTGPFMVFWESNTTGPLGSFEITDRGDTEMINGLEPGSYTVTIVSANGLEWIEIIFLEEEESFFVLLTPDQGINGFSLSCADSEDGSIQTEVIGAVNNPLSYQWSNGQTGELLVDAAAGFYTVTVTDTRGCTATGMAQITGPPDIDLQLLSMDLTCFGDDDGVVVVDTVIGGLTPYEFTLTNQSSGLNTAWFNLSPGNYGVTVTDDNGCSGSEITTINTPAPVTVDLGPDEAIALGTSVTVDFQSSVFGNNLDTVLWNGPDLEDCENCIAQALMPLFSSSYGVTVIDTAGCIGSDEINIQVIKDRAVYIPNVFSPNGDGNNDRFFISTNAEAVEILELNIYNRWGAIVFSDRNFAPNNPGLGWDGAFKKQEVNPGVFVYYARIQFLDGEEKEYSGDITILK